HAFFVDLTSHFLFKALPTAPQTFSCSQALSPRASPKFPVQTRCGGPLFLCSPRPYRDRRPLRSPRAAGHRQPARAPPALASKSARRAPSRRVARRQSADVTRGTTPHPVLHLHIASYTYNSWLSASTTHLPE